jgi:hypothetical protein
MQFTTSRGKAATKGKSPGFATLDPNAVYRVVDERAKGKPVVSSGTGLEGLQAAQASVAQLNAQQGKKNNWRVEMVDPVTGRVSVVADANPRKGLLGKIADIALPVAASFIPGVGPVLGAAIGSAASSVAQGRSLENTLLRSGLSAATAGAMNLTGADRAISNTLSNAFAPAASEAAKTGLQKAAEAGVGEIVVSGTRSALPSLISGAVSGGLGSQLAGMGPSNEIVVSGSSPTSPPQAMPIVPPLAPFAPAPMPAPEIVVSGATPQEPEMVPSVIPPVAPAAPTTPNDIQDAFDQEFGDPDANKSSLLDEIIKYYALGAGGLELLGGALGGRGGSGAGTPYNSQLGPMPTFARSAFTPFTGDYETYGFGPEWNFFGGTPPPTPSGPPAGILPPAALPDMRLV